VRVLQRWGDSGEVSYRRGSTGHIGKYGVTVAGRLWPLFFLVVLVPLVATCARWTGVKRPRNVILIAVDTLRQDHLGCYGYGRGNSRTIDHLAERGVRFTQARTAVPLTLPSFTTIFTSTYPLTHMVRQNETYSLNDSVTTMTEVFKGAGFKTMAVIGSAALASRYGLNQGFDGYDDEFGPLEGKRVGSIPAPSKQGPVTRRRAKEVVDRAVDWLEVNSEGPFFLFLHFFDPHLPYDTPEKLPMDGYGEEELPTWAYDSEIASVDRQLGRLFENLEKLDLEGNTLVVLTADHGEGLMEHMEATHGYLLYDSTVRIPLIFSCPGIIPEGKVVDETFRTIDLAPTLIDLFGLEIPGAMQGISHRESILGDAKSPEVSAYFETYYARIFLGWSALRGVQWRQWKYIQAPAPELYNLADDPHEEVNLFDKRPEVAESMKKRLASIRATYSRTHGRMARTVPMDPGHKEILESLGYMTKVVDTGEEADSLLPDPKDMMPSYSQRQIVLGRIHLSGQMIQMGRYDAGIRLLKTIEDAGDRQWMVHYNMGLALMGKSEVKGARREFQAALARAPVGPERVQIREAIRYLDTKN